MLQGGQPVEAKDANGTTALSEAASGGVESAVRLLLERRANPNTRGEFQRTPLWRSGYAGHCTLMSVLLEHGSDPRLYDEQGQAPVDVSTKDDILETLRAWDVARTDELVEEFDSWSQEQRLNEEFMVQEAMRSVTAEHEQAKGAHDIAQSALARAKVQMRNREKEHGLGLAAGEEAARLSCMSADAELKHAGEAAAAAQARYDKANIARLAAAEHCGASPAALPGREISVTDLNNVLLRDIGERIAKAPRWPLLIDPSECGRKLLLYAGCSVVNFWRPDDMDPGRLRIALLSMIRAGGILAVDLSLFAAGVDRALLSGPFEQIQPWLFDELMERKDGKANLLLPRKAAMPWPRFHELVQKEEKHMYGVEHFNDDRTAKFKFMVVTSIELPHAELLDSFEVYRAIANT
mmetsp:Transcript_104766/g.337758  ORF Transcript_104766/g.337758 Transcript_104766/m.337758 type:complete len:408 (+) Transcript_104766:61-1284(+)